MVAIERKAAPPRRQKLSLKKCLFSFLVCLLLLFVAVTILVLSSNGFDTDSSHQQSAPWQRMEPASLSSVHPPRLAQDSWQSQQTPDGHFNGFPVYLQTASSGTHSSVHCVGDNYQDDAWLHRSCHFSMLCYDLEASDFVIFQSHNHEVLERFLQARPAMKASVAMHTSGGTNDNPIVENKTQSVALGGLNLKWSLPVQEKPSPTGFQWFPRVLPASFLNEYYALPTNTVLIPYHSLSAKNPGHLVWDDFLPIYTLLTMFQLQNRVILPLRVLLNDKLWSSCETSPANENLCQKMTQKFIALLVGRDYPYNITRADQIYFQTNSNTMEKQSNYICASHGAAGLGALTDHGTKKLHGWMRDDYKRMQNQGRAALLQEFRSYMLHNVGIAADVVPSQPPFKIVFSLSSSDIESRNLDFQKQMDIIRQSFPPDLIEIIPVSLKDLSVFEQVKLASETAIFISICGGGAVTGMFLPKGASVILYYLEHGGVEYGVPTHLPAHLDWDLFNNMAHLRVHWLPTQTMDQRVDLRALVLLIREELDLIQAEILL